MRCLAHAGASGICRGDFQNMQNPATFGETSRSCFLFHVCVVLTHRSKGGRKNDCLLFLLRQQLQRIYHHFDGRRRRMVIPDGGWFLPSIQQGAVISVFRTRMMAKNSARFHHNKWEFLLPVLLSIFVFIFLQNNTSIVSFGWFSHDHINSVPDVLHIFRGKP